MKYSVVATLALGAALASTGCCGKSKSSLADNGSGTGKPGSAGETAGLMSISSAHAQFNAPAGWTKYSSNGWTMFKPPDNIARLGFVLFDKPNESTCKIGQIASALELGAVSWKGSAVGKTIGPDRFPAQSGTGTCKFTSTGNPCELTYATVNPGGVEQILIVYAVNASGNGADKANAEAAIQSLRKM